MGKNRGNGDKNTLSKLNDHAAGWIMGFYDIIEEEMDSDEIEYVQNHMENIKNFSEDGVWRAESTTRTFNVNNLEVGKTFTFDGLKAFSKELETAEGHSLESLGLKGDVTLFKLTSGKAFDVTKDLDTHNEQEVWVGTGPFKVDKITETNASSLNYAKLGLNQNMVKKLDEGKIRIVEISEI